MLDFLFVFGIMLSCICTLLSCLHTYAYFFHAFMLFVCFCLVVYFLFCFVFKIKIKRKNKKNTKTMCFVYIGACVPWMAIETKFSKLCIFCSLDEHLYTQLSKWALWLLFVMSKIELSFILNTRITLFDGKD